MQTIVLPSTNGKKLTLYLRDEVDQSVYNEIFKLGEYRSAEQVITVARYPIIDVGAHAGFFSLWCRNLNESVPIIAIEPEPGNLSFLKKHVEDNHLNGIEVVEAALARKTGNRALLVSADSHTHRLLEDERNTKNTISVQGISFADVCKKHKIKKVSLMKLDIEGGEYEVFEGMKSDDFALVNFVILEYHGSNRYKEIEEVLRENGFSVQVFPSRFDKTLGFIFARNKRFVS